MDVSMVIMASGIARVAVESAILQLIGWQTRAL